MSGDRLQRILVWMLVVAVAVYLLERLFILTALFATPLLLFGLAWLFALVLKPMVDRMTQMTLPVPFRHPPIQHDRGDRADLAAAARRGRVAGLPCDHRAGGRRRRSRWCR